MSIIKKTSTENTTTNSIKYDVTVSNARVISEDVVSFDMTANGVRIYGMIYRAGTSDKDEEYELISFPSKKAKNGKYYSHCWFPISNELKAYIIDELEKLM